MARKDWDIKSIPIYATSADHDLFPARFFDVYDYSELISKYIPIAYIAGLLKLSDQRFANMLNSPIDSKYHLITSYEKYFRKGKYKFEVEDIFSLDSDITVELADFEYWLDDNWELLKENNVKHDDEENIPARMAALEAEKTTLRAENEKLKERLAEIENAAPDGGEDAESWLEEYPVCRMIKDLHNEGKNRDEVRLSLSQKYSNAQTGFLTQADTNVRTDDAVKKSVARVKSKIK